MTVDRNELRELYLIALEEARHHDRLYNQSWAPGILIVSVVGALGFFTWRDFLAPEALFSFRLFVTLLAIVLGYFFTRSVCQHTVEADICRDIANKIEDILAGKIYEETIEIRDLLVVQKIKESRGRWYKQLYFPFIRQPGKLAYLFIYLAAWTYLWWWVIGIYIR